MGRKVIGYSIGAFGLGILISSAIFPMGLFDSNTVFIVMKSVGITLIIIGLFFRPTEKVKKKHF